MGKEDFLFPLCCGKCDADPDMPRAVDSRADGCCRLPSILSLGEELVALSDP